MEPGDPAGLARSTQTEDGVNNYTIILSNMNSPILKAKQKLLSKQPSQTARLEFINELFKCTPPGYLENLGSDKIGSADNDIAIHLSEGPTGRYKATVANDTVDRFVYLPLPVNEVDVEAKSSSFTDVEYV